MRYDPGQDTAAASPVGIIHPFRFRVVCSLIACSLVACSVGDAEPPSLSTASDTSAITNGTAVADPTQHGVVEIIDEWGGPKCTGVLLTNDWVITAAHCFSEDSVDQLFPFDPKTGIQGGAITPGTSPFQAKMGAYSAEVDLVVIHPDYRGAGFRIVPVDTGTVDAALMHLTKPLPVRGNISSWTQGIFGGNTTELTGWYPTAHCMGYGYSGGTTGFPDGTLVEGDAVLVREEDTSKTAFRMTPGPALPNSGDSGSTCFLPMATSSTGRLNTGVFSWFGGDGARMIKPEVYRTWVLEWIAGTRAAFATPPELKEWDTWGLKPNLDETIAWDPCQGGPFTWSARYELEPNRDFIHIGDTALTGVVWSSGWGRDELATGSEAGPISVRFVTDGAGRSLGLKMMEARCTDKSSKAWSNPWGKPLPASFSGTVAWNPCDGGDFTWKATYDFAAGHSATLTAPDGTSQQLSGTGTFAGTFSARTITVDTTGGAPGAISQGITSLTAQCRPSIVCHSTSCVSVPNAFPAGTSISRTWTPCNGQPFFWRLRYASVPGRKMTVGSRQPGRSEDALGEMNDVSTSGSIDVSITKEAWAAPESFERFELSALCDLATYEQLKFSPSNLQAYSYPSALQIGLNWRDNNLREQETLVFRRIADGSSPWLHVGTVPANVTWFVDTGDIVPLWPGTTYQYKVVARNAIASSPDSNVVAATASIGEPNETESAAFWFNPRWTAGANWNATFYLIVRYNDTHDWYTISNPYPYTVRKTIRVLSNAPGWDIDLQVKNPVTNQSWWSTSWTSNETVIAYIPAYTSFRIHVYRYSGEFDAAYTLSLSD